MTNLASLLKDTATRYPERTAVVIGDMRLSYAQLDQYTDFVAAALAQYGVGPGDKVALTCPNLPYFTIAYYGILKAGAAVVPLNVLLKSREVAYHLNDSGAKAYFCFEGTEDLPMGREGVLGFKEAEACENLFVITADLQGYSKFAPHRTMMQVMTEAAQTGAPVPALDIADDDTAVILYTSGTTGQPKGAELSHANMLSNALASEELFKADAENLTPTCACCRSSTPSARPSSRTPRSPTAAPS
ncbi:AMP-binding protein [Nocardioides yefusunii]|uniref:AMP-binding protein n=1 Tax=Nocardioides yefusunii TaxID=2500546 RepID=UPI0024117AA9|nr:AMP-binding protein [Nocardioides yefusunii]